MEENDGVGLDLDSVFQKHLGLANLEIEAKDAIFHFLFWFLIWAIMFQSGQSAILAALGMLHSISLWLLIE